MRFKNQSSVTIPKDFWIALAEVMNVVSVLPEAVEDEYGMYKSCKTLRVSVRQKRHRKKDLDGLGQTGYYTCGHIVLFPCLKCSAASLTNFYLDNLASAWLHQYHESLYIWSLCNPSWSVLDTFADRGFEVLGGTVGGPICSKYRLNLRTAMNRLSHFRKYTESLTYLSRSKIKSWKPRC